MHKSAGPDALDPGVVCAAAERAHAVMVAAEAQRFELAAVWADLHPGEELEQRRRAGRSLGRGVERGVQLGADGTPLVAEFAPMELGALWGMGHVAARAFVRDALDVRHRHPLLWDAVLAGRVRVWQARDVARECASAGLDRDQARWVDRVTAEYAGALPWSRFEALVQAKVIEVDPEAAEQRRLAAALARFVRTGQSSEFGLKTLVARASAGDVIFFVAMVDRIAQILGEGGDTDPVDVRRSKAVGILATPHRAVAMLEAAAGAAASAESESESESEPDPETHPDETASDETPETTHTTQADGPLCGMCGAGPGRALVKPTAGQLRRLLPSAVLYVHLSEASLRARGGVARCEGVGPITVEQVAELLGHANVRVVPVLDVAGQVSVDAYEVPDRIAEALRLRDPACVSPWGSMTSRGRDLDHTVAYRSPARGGPPAQTGMHNLGGLSRFAHRVKTHGRWQLRQPSPGVFEWRSPHGHRYRVDHTGTRRIRGDDEGEVLRAGTGESCAEVETHRLGIPVEIHPELTVHAHR